jgi:ATP-dependent Clp protease ATP-binding subunit ClpB
MLYGARPLRRYIQREVETPIGRALLAGEIDDGSTVTLDAVDGALQFDWGRAADPSEPVGAAA